MPSSVAKSIVTVASSGNGFMNTSSSRAPRAVTPQGNDHDRAAVELHGAVARPPPSSSVVIWCSTATSPPSTSTIGGGERRLDEVAEGHLDAALGRHVHDGRGGRLRRRCGGGGLRGRRGGRGGVGAGVGHQRRRGDVTGEHGHDGAARLVGGVGDQHDVVGEAVVGGGAAGAVPRGGERGGRGGGRHGDAGDHGCRRLVPRRDRRRRRGRARRRRRHRGSPARSDARTSRARLRRGVLTGIVGAGVVRHGTDRSSGGGVRRGSGGLVIDIG